MKALQPIYITRADIDDIVQWLFDIVITIEKPRSLSIAMAYYVMQNFYEDILKITLFAETWDKNFTIRLELKAQYSLSIVTLHDEFVGKIKTPDIISSTVKEARIFYPLIFNNKIIGQGQKYSFNQN